MRGDPRAARQSGSPGTRARGSAADAALQPVRAGFGVSRVSIRTPLRAREVGAPHRYVCPDLRPDTSSTAAGVSPVPAPRRRCAGTRAPSARQPRIFHGAMNRVLQSAPLDSCDGGAGGVCCEKAAENKLRECAVCDTARARDSSQILRGPPRRSCHGSCQLCVDARAQTPSQPSMQHSESIGKCFRRPKTSHKSAESGFPYWLTIDKGPRSVAVRGARVCPCRALLVASRLASLASVGVVAPGRGTPQGSQERSEIV
jgi:hypothetical protein